MIVSMSISSPRHVTVADVARHTGLTIGTVSKALNGRGNLRDETRERVRSAAAELGYQPNGLARSLRMGKSLSVGMISTESFSRFSGPVALGAEETFGAGQIGVFMCDGREDPIREAHYIKWLLARRVDGIIVTGRRREPRQSIGENLPVPVVYALGPSANPEDDSVAIDDAQGASLAVEHLLAGGRRRIAHITGPQHHMSAQLRADQFERSLSAAGIDADPRLTIWGSWSEAWGREATRMLIKSTPDLDAIFCGSDQIARGTLDALRELGRHVPADVAVVGFDNWDTMVDGAVPGLTSVDAKLTRLGHEVAQHLLDAMVGSPHSGLTLMKCELVVRESSGAVRTTR
jgi:LacI family transcriptional regulator